MKLDSLRQHRFGVNYVPSRNWYTMWNDFEADAVTKDLNAIAALSLDHIRLQTIWPWFQPNPNVVSQAHLDRLHKVVEMCAERKIDVWVTTFTGWLSGYAFRPPYVRDETFYQPESWDVQERYLTALLHALRDCPNFAGLDLGNELNCAWQAADLSRGDAWMGKCLSHCAEQMPGGVHVNGVDHNPWFAPTTFSPTFLARSQAIVPLHCWTFFTDPSLLAPPR